MGAYSARVIADGASYYWRLGETVGTTAVDEKGLANGTISGGVTLGAAGAIADGTKAMTFDGTTGQIQTAATVTFPTTATLEVWLKIAVATGEYPCFSLRNPPYPADRVVVTVLNGRPFCYATGGGTSGTPLVANNLWHHVVWVFTGTTCVIYTDGIPNSGDPMVRATIAVTASLGWDQEGAGHFPGSLDEIAIYPRALTAPEIAAHYTLAVSAARSPLQFGYWKQQWHVA